MLTCHLARDLPHKTGAGGATRERLLDTDNPNMGAVGKEVKGRTHTYYQVILCFLYHVTNVYVPNPSL